MAEEIVKADWPVVELLPPTEFKGLREALLDLRTEYDVLPALKEQVLALPSPIPLGDAETYIKYGELSTRIRSLRKQAKAKIAPFKATVDEIDDFLKGEQKKYEAKADEVDGICSNNQADYNRRDREQKEAEEREQQRLVDEANAREADEKRKNAEIEAKAKRDAAVKDIRERLRLKKITKRQAEKELRDAGATAEAELTRAAIEADEKKANPPKVTVESKSVAVAGQRRTHNWYGKCSYPDVVLAAFVKNIVTRMKLKVPAKVDIAIMAEVKADPLREFIEISDQKVGEKARKTKDNDKMRALLPGCEFWDKDAV